MKKNLMFLALAAVGLASCNGGFKKGENGLLYNKYTDKSGPKINEGDFVMVNLVVKNDADSVLFSTYEDGHPQPLLVPKPQFHGDLFDGIKLLAEGDSATIKLSADSIFKKSPKPPTFKGKYVIYDVKVEKLIPKGKMTDQIFQSTVTTYMTGLSTANKNAEPAKITKYIADNKLNVTKTDSGLYYVITQKGSGPTIMPGDTAVINYSGTTLNGKMFDSNIKADAIKGKLPNVAQRSFAPIRVPVGRKAVIAGWDQGLLLLNKGAKATFVIPSSLAYGERGNGPIGGYTPLAFNVELVDIVHPKLTATKPTVALPPVKSVPLKK
ncbi:FKBP-type peptidyl-prolyl cis-trans isomerase [Mucilaginibacter sp.]|uniref:FKBP-type peptidyl-prolyl cis-trans isomerase n=1 Tax=Mucilaginibacter sp. TaxID=1882438 RepID=UPI002606432A|nr:FKBP-type peptidyl-prolyl cis-trans isomerase [Mucilaginibacter sp.]